MLFRHIAVLIVAVSVLTPLAAAPAAGQSAQNATVDGEAVSQVADSAGGDGGATDAANATRRVSPDLRLVSATVRDDGRAAVTFRADDGPVTVTLADGGALNEGSGTIPTETRVLAAGETLTMTVPVTEVSGRAAVTIYADGPGGRAFYGEVIEPSNEWFSGSPTWTETRMAGLGGFLGGLGVVALLARREVADDSKEVERYL